MTPAETSTVGFQYAMLSDVGRVRQGNEDFCAASPKHGVFVVCDGMGGAAAGEVASELAATAFVEAIEASSTASAEKLLDAAVRRANAVVYLKSTQSPRLRGMGTTLVALFLPQRGPGLWLANVGDSRCYRLRDGVLTQLTRDHSLVQEQVLAGQLTPEQAEHSPMRNIITRAIGSREAVEADLRELELHVGDLYLLTSDGLTRELTDEAVQEHLLQAKDDLASTCRSLVNAANRAGGRDNITVLLLRMLH